MKSKILKMQTELIRLANKIRSNRRERNFCTWSLSDKARHLHMLYGVVRGLSMESIESKSRTVLSGYTLQKLCEEFELEVDCEKIICHSRSVII